MTGDMKIKFEQHVQLAKYYDAMIQLFSEMCLDRSYNSINFLSRQYSLEMLLGTVMNENLPDRIRGSFTMLLRRLWLDRFPHETLRVPKYVRVMENSSVASANQDTLPQYKLSEQHLCLTNPER